MAEKRIAVVLYPDKRAEIDLSRWELPRLLNVVAAAFEEFDLSLPDRWVAREEGDTEILSLDGIIQHGNVIIVSAFRGPLITPDHILRQ